MPPQIAGKDIVFKAGTNVVIDASGVSVKGVMVNLNSGGAAGSGAPPAPNAPTEPAEAKAVDPKKPEEDADAKSGSASAPEALQ